MPKEHPMVGSQVPGTVRQRAQTPTGLKGTKIGKRSSGGSRSGPKGSQKLTNGGSTGIMRNP